MKINLHLPDGRAVTIIPDRRNFRGVACMTCKREIERLRGMRVQQACAPDNPRPKVLGTICPGCVHNILDEYLGKLFQEANCGGETIFYETTMLIGVSVDFVRGAMTDCRRALLHPNERKG